MTNVHHPHQSSTGRPSFLRSPVGVALIMVGVILAFFVLREHWSHVVGKLPYLLLLACPLMHLFGHGHRGHGGQKHGSGTPQDTADSGKATR